MVEAEDLTWIKTERKNQYWEVGFKEMALKHADGRREVISDCAPCHHGRCTSSGGSWQGRGIASIDTGHSLISGPPSWTQGLTDRITPKDSDCNNHASLPTLVFNFEGQDLEMQPDDYLVKMSGQCVPGIRERPPRNGHDYVFGEHFLRSFYAIFDRENDRIGLAPSKEVADGGLDIKHITQQYTPTQRGAESESDADEAEGADEDEGGLERRGRRAQMARLDELERGGGAADAGARHGATRKARTRRRRRSFAAAARAALQPDNDLGY